MQHFGSYQGLERTWRQGCGIDDIDPKLSFQLSGAVPATWSSLQLADGQFHSITRNSEATQLSL